MEQALAPWHLEVVIESSPPTDTAMAGARAEADTARFVVWRDGMQLVVYDRELEFTERRDSRSGALDPPTAAAAALTIKMMMRLPLPPEADAPALSSGTPAVSGWGLRLEVGLAGRLTYGSSTSQNQQGQNQQGQNQQGQSQQGQSHRARASRASTTNRHGSAVSRRSGHGSRQAGGLALLDLAGPQRAYQARASMGRGVNGPSLAWRAGRTRCMPGRSSRASALGFV
jgi:hypothetical protein